MMKNGGGGGRWGATCRSAHRAPATIRRGLRVPYVAKRANGTMTSIVPYTWFVMFVYRKATFGKIYARPRRPGRTGNHATHKIVNYAVGRPALWPPDRGCRIVPERSRPFPTEHFIMGNKQYMLCRARCPIAPRRNLTVMPPTEKTFVGDDARHRPACRALPYTAPHHPQQPRGHNAIRTPLSA